MKRLAKGFCIFFLKLCALVIIGGICSGLVWASYYLAGVPGMCGSAVLAFVMTAIPAYRRVPTLKIGMVTFLSIRTGRVLEEGPQFVIPWFESVALFDYEVQTIDMEETFFCADNLAVIVEGTLRWRIYKNLLSTAYVENRQAIASGLPDAIRSEIGSVAGANSALDFKGAWQAISNLINCSLKMGTPLHVAQGILPSDRLNFYGDRDSAAIGKLARDRRRNEERSEIENRYGIEVIDFSVGRVRYTERTSGVLEEEGQAILRSKAHRVISATKRLIAGDLREDGLRPQEAENAAEVTMNLAERKIHTLDGLDRLRPFLPPESRNFGGYLCRT